MQFKQTVQGFLKNPCSTISSSAIVFRWMAGGNDIEVLTATRGNEPWAGHIIIASGGYVDPTDTTPLHTVRREICEETGGDQAGKKVGTRLARAGLIIEPKFLVGIFGPERYHYRAVIDPTTPLGFRAVKTGDNGHIIPVVNITTACQVVNGEMEDTDELQGLAWREVMELVATDGHRLTFDDALQLEKFMSFIRGQDRQRDMLSAIAALRFFY